MALPKLPKPVTFFHYEILFFIIQIYRWIKKKEMGWGSRQDKARKWEIISKKFQKFAEDYLHCIMLLVVNITI